MSLAQKINRIVQYKRDYLIKNHALKASVFVFDSSNKVYMIPIDNKKFTDLNHYRNLFSRVLAGAIEEIEYSYNTTITHVLYVYVDVFDTTVTDIVNLDTRYQEDEHRRNAMIVMQEDKFNTNLNIYDCISIVDEDGTFTIVSDKPIKKVSISKLDNDQMIKGFLTNILK